MHDLRLTLEGLFYQQYVMHNRKSLNTKRFTSEKPPDRPSLSGGLHIRILSEFQFTEHPLCDPVIPFRIRVDGI